MNKNLIFRFGQITSLHVEEKIFTFSLHQAIIIYILMIVKIKQNEKMNFKM